MSIQRDLKPSSDLKTSVWQNNANNQQNNFLTVTMSDKFWKKKKDKDDKDKKFPVRSGRFE